MKNLKKWAALGLCLCLLFGIAAAEDTAADDTVQTSAADTQQTGTVQAQGNRNGRQPQNMPNGRGGARKQNGNQQPDSTGSQQPAVQPDGVSGATQQQNANGKQGGRKNSTDKQKNQSSQPPELPEGVTEPKQDENGQPPELPEGVTEPKQGENGQPPELPEGVTEPKQDENGQPPALPDGEEPAQGENGQPPELPEGEAQAQPVTVQTGNKSGLKLRSKPNQKSKVMGTFRNGTEVEILEVSDEWVKVRVGDKTGYMMVKFLEGDIQAAAETAETSETADTTEAADTTDSTESTEPGTAADA